ncbi:MAG TPA: hypothetical protein VGB77_17755 [Abditibacteriaceae bacterium]|jgi:hypothetical protein
MPAPKNLMRVVLTVALLCLFSRSGGAEEFPKYEGYAPATEAMRKWKAAGNHVQILHAANTALIWAKTDVERADTLLFVASELVDYQDPRPDFFHVRREGDLESARRRYGEILKLPAASAQQKAQAQLGVAETYRLQAKLTFKAEHMNAAREGYVKALALPELSPEARSEALLGKAEMYASLNNSLIPVRREEVQAALADYNQVLAIEAAPPTKKAQALLGISAMQDYLEQPQEALAALKRVLEMPGATIAQKTQALFTQGRQLAVLNRREEARAAWAQIIAMEGAEALQKINAHRLLIRFDLQDKNLAAVPAQIAQINVLLAGLPDDKKVQERKANASLLSRAGFPALARTEYEAVRQIPGASVSESALALRAVGATYEEEKNYAKAREVWETALLIKDVSPMLQTMLLEDIGKSYALQGLYPAARGAYQRLIALPRLKELASKEISIGEAWLLIGDSYLAEKNYTEARRAYGKAEEGGEVMKEEAQKKLQLLEAQQKAG